MSASGIRQNRAHWYRAEQEAKALKEAENRAGSTVADWVGKLTR